ncbi:MAG: ClpX C4-type zinc finger protein, partial [bacterium]
MTRCSFCGKNENETGRLVLGNDSAVCGECVKIFSGMMDEDRGKNKPGDFSDLPDPKKINEE